MSLLNTHLLYDYANPGARNPSAVNNLRPQSLDGVPACDCGCVAICIAVSPQALISPPIAYPALLGPTAPHMVHVIDSLSLFFLQEVGVGAAEQAYGCV